MIQLVGNDQDLCVCVKFMCYHSFLKCTVSSNFPSKYN